MKYGDEVCRSGFPILRITATYEGGSKKRRTHYLCPMCGKRFTKDRK